MSDDAAPDAPLLPAPPPPTATARAGAPWSVVLVALGVAVVSLAVAVTALLTRPEDRLDEVRQSALDAARERTETLTTYDHRTLDEDFAQVLATATGAFEQEYRRTSEQLEPTFLTTQAVAEAEVVGAGLESLQVPDDGPPRAVAVLAVDQVIRTVGAPARTERNRLRMELVRPDDTWLVARVERL